MEARRPRCRLVPFPEPRVDMGLVMVGIAIAYGVVRSRNGSFSEKSCEVDLMSTSQPFNSNPLSFQTYF